ncbi:hypothetical protein V1L54_26005 [Streptomyces sp. TRM 70361]|uniref:hypothetical protein n=1 Tax=Streptomyces sp. TRM 70361 TaxID=3116553 RepID=UPI002E7C290B|nr:hypothetical protein [Streptomyces sp. TRM 70361]MEE1942822.1 hypothetical protein [Streptomyces sp. TRM 70361]
MNIPVSTEKPATAPPPATARRTWQPPVVECREVRAEVTAYAGARPAWPKR